MTWKPTAEDRERYRKIREQFKDRPTIEQLIERGELSGAFVPQGLYLSLREAIGQLRRAREAAGLSLADLAHRSGTTEDELAHLESDLGATPNLATLVRYAGALGKMLQVRLVEAPAQRSGT